MAPRPRVRTNRPATLKPPPGGDFSRNKSAGDSPYRILEGLNPEQTSAVRTVRGPVVILAGGGSGKTTTITRRIAYQVATGTVEPRGILAVALTRKARTEMRHRLQGFGIVGAGVLTIHGAAYAQLRMLHRARACRYRSPSTTAGARTREDDYRGGGTQHANVYRKDLLTIIDRAKGSLITTERFERDAANWPLPTDIAT